MEEKVVSTNEKITVRRIGKQVYQISQNGTYSVRVVTSEGQVMVAPFDLATCMGFQNPSRVASRLNYPKKKILTPLTNKSSPRSIRILYISSDDATEFVSDYAETDFRNWYFESMIPSLKSLYPKIGSHEKSTPPFATEEHSSVEKNIGDKIDQIIIELLTMKQQFKTTA